MEIGVKNLSVALIVLCGLLAGSAHASTWEKVADSKVSRIFVDTSSINRVGDIVALWYRRDFNRPMSTEKHRRPYRSSKILNYYNCAEHEVATARWITYEGNEGQGNVIFDEKVEPLAYGDVSDDESGKALFDFACRRGRKN